jgi:hypothetical protein
MTDDGHHLPPHRATRVRAMLVVCSGPTVDASFAVEKVVTDVGPASEL